MLKIEWDEESNDKLLHLFISSKTANLVPKFAVEDLPLAEHSDDDNVNYNNKQQRTKPCCDFSYSEDKIKT